MSFRDLTVDKTVKTILGFHDLVFSVENCQTVRILYTFYSSSGIMSYLGRSLLCSLVFEE